MLCGRALKAVEVRIMQFSPSIRQPCPSIFTV